MRSNLAVALLCLFVVERGNAASIAIIDSGTDYKHRDLKSNIWQNKGNSDITDADGKKYANVINGWNFAENNNQIIDYKYLGTFSADCYKIFEVQARIVKGTATAEDKDWYNKKKSDQAFIKELSKFGNFVHGTHVAGITAQDQKDARVIGMKLIPTEPPGMRRMIQSIRAKNPGRAENPMVKLLLGMLAKRQATLLVTVGKFVGATDATVANGSFGTSVKAVLPIVKQLVKQFGGAEPSDAEAEAYAKYFVSEIATASKGFVDAAPKTLFVFAAANDGTNNDSMPVSPANIKASNTIAVAATNGNAALASFSNYGATMVEVAAPGVDIDSTIPGDKRLGMSGTSMAAPYVANVAGAVIDANPKLTPAEVKKILMGTVDEKEFLRGKVSTSGIVNKERAVKAARFSRDIALQAAIVGAHAEVGDEPTRAGTVDEKDLIVQPLPTLLF